MTELKPIAELGNNPLNPDDMPLSDRDQLILELVEVGVSVRKAENLVKRFSGDRIRRQLDWLPYRSARRPASMIIAAIENNYDEPAYAE
jgi:hypothetical protein